jgi:U32 family peptidase
VKYLDNQLMEILSPAGNLQKLKTAVRFGADAVYTSGKNFGLRAKSTNLSESELQEAVLFCKENSKKIYVTVNIFADNNDADALPEYLIFLQKIKVDGIIVADPAVFATATEFCPDIPLHISTQANVTSWKSAEFWYKLGARRIIVARELSIEQIRTIKEKIPDLEIEMFVHGAMCMAYSGRCLISSFLNNRSANKGECTHPCRWKYNLTEETRPGEYFPVEEDSTGTYIMNSKDLCLLNRLQEIIDAGVDSIKIEGRMKSMYYAANVTRIYKTAVKLLSVGKKAPDLFIEELHKVSHRVYAEGFFDGFNSNETQHYESSAYIREHQFLGEITEVKGNETYVFVRSKFFAEDEIDIIFPDINDDLHLKGVQIFDEENNSLDFTKPNTIVKLKLNQNIPMHGILRKKI